MNRGALARASLITASTLLAVGFAELAVRALPPTALGYEFVNDHFIRPREFAKDTTLNSLGVHDREPKARKAGVRRVLLLGDSYVAAVSVPIVDGVARRLEAHLSEFPEIGPVEVVSLSKEGWGQRDELVALKRHGKRLAPDLVLLLFTTRNDLYNNATRLPEKRRAQRLIGKVREEGIPMPELISAESARGLWFPGSSLNRLISHRLTLASARETTPAPVQFHAFAPAKQESWSEAWEETERLLVRLRKQTRTLGAGFAIAAASTPEGLLAPAAGADQLRNAHRDFAETEFDTDLVDHELARICDERSIAFTALQPDLRRIQEERGEALHWRYDGHWNRAGNDEAARLLAAFAASQLGPAPRLTSGLALSSTALDVALSER